MHQQKVMPWAVLNDNPTTAALYSQTDRKSTRLNSSHDQISYAVFCLKKKKKHLVGPVVWKIPHANSTLVQRNYAPLWMNNVHHSQSTTFRRLLFERHTSHIQDKSVMWSVRSAA